MDLNLLMPWLGALALLISLGTSIHTFVMSGSKQVGGQLKVAEKTLIDHDRRIQAIESEMKHLPDREMAHKLEIAMERIAGRLDTMDERLRPIAATNHRLHELLLEQAQK